MGKILPEKISLESSNTLKAERFWKIPCHFKVLLVLPINGERSWISRCICKNNIINSASSPPIPGHWPHTDPGCSLAARNQFVYFSIQVSCNMVFRQEQTNHSVNNVSKTCSQINISDLQGCYFQIDLDVNLLYIHTKIVFYHKPKFVNQRSQSTFIYEAHTAVVQNNSFS